MTKTMKRWPVGRPLEVSGPSANKLNEQLLFLFPAAGRTNHRPTRHRLAQVRQRLSGTQYPIVLQVAIQLASEGIDPEPFLSAMLAARSTPGFEARFLSIAGLAAHCAGLKVDPAGAVKVAVEAALTVSANRAFEDVLGSLAVAAEGGASSVKAAVRRGSAPRPGSIDELQAVAALPVDRQQPALDLIGRGMMQPIGDQFNLRKYVAALDFGLRLAVAQPDALSCLRTIDSLANSVTWEQFLYALDFVLAQARPGFPTASVLPEGAILAARVSTSLAEFRQMLALMVQAFEERGRPPVELWSQSASSLDRAALISVLDFLRKRGGEGSIDHHSFSQLLARIVELVPPSTGKFAASLELIPHLPARHGASAPAKVAEALVEAARRVSRLPADREANLTAFCGLYQRLPAGGVRIDPDSLVAALQMFDVPMANEAVAREVELLRRLVERSRGQLADNLNTPGIVEMYRQASALRDYYPGFEIIARPPVTHTEDYSDYYGTQSNTVIDRPGWLEVQPSGQPLCSLVPHLVPAAAAQELMTRRSWLWQNTSNEVAQAKTVERIARVRAYIPAALDALMKCGLLRPPLMSVYLLGSYPWVDAPGDIDLFVVVPGSADPVYYNPRQVRDRGSDLNIANTPLTLEVVGEQTLRQASKGVRMPSSERLALRYACLYGAALLAGADIFASTQTPPKSLAALAADLRNDAARADWPELRASTEKQRRKKDWREREARALDSFLRANPSPLD